MSRKLSKKLNIDTRTASDIENRISELSNLYDTGWHFDAEDPDIGTAIAKIYAGEMEENISRVNDILGRYHRRWCRGTWARRRRSACRCKGCRSWC